MGDTSVSQPGDRADRGSGLGERGRWLLLYSEGQLVLLDEHREFVAVLGSEASVPATARRLLFDPFHHEVVVGSAHEGIMTLRWP